jgi:deoxyribodipyrimidine photolyase-related protein
MKAYEERLKKNGYNVTYVVYTENWKKLAQKYQLTIIDPLDIKLRKKLPKSSIILESPGFLGGTLQKSTRYRMATFYQEQRKRLNILVKNGKPTGGQWSFDEENRKKLPKNHTIPPLSTYSNKHIKEAFTYIEKNFKNNPGTPHDFMYPVTHTSAQQWLKKFIQERLHDFGTYEDAIAQNEPFIYHSLLSPLLNIGLLTPEHVITEVLKAKAPINSTEGFIRQVIGWREFILQIYLLEGENQRKSNFFNNTKRIPESFYTGTTGIIPVDNAIHKVLLNAYNHHIERLMILGNFMLLSGYAPASIYQWFMELYIDSYDWVMVPNVFGMSQYADGGLMATKPYISSSNYVLKMSDFEPGKWCEVWDELFWDFIKKHKQKLKANGRMGLLLSQLDKRMAKKT